VLLEEAVEALSLREGGVYIDATFGGGGHTRRILDDPREVRQVIAIDADHAAADRAGKLAATLGNPDRLRFVSGNFGDLGSILQETGVAHVDGILFDLGLSSFQLDTPERGFAFRFDGPLDMRFGQNPASQTVAEIIAGAPVDELTTILRQFGEEPRARRIAQAIDRARQRETIETTAQLLDIVLSVTGPHRGKGAHPATRTFQALRIAANRELDMLRAALEVVPDVLAPGGRLVVLAFHSLEDRIVKQFIEWEAADCICPPEQPVCTCDHLARLRKIGKAVRASDAEQERNPRSRSVVMRVAERLSLDEALARKRTLRAYEAWIPDRSEGAGSGQ
jgi:16S rRNA (cytosine1402-N4)-methyltransferase